MIWEVPDSEKPPVASQELQDHLLRYNKLLDVQCYWMKQHASKQHIKVHHTKGSCKTYDRGISHLV